MRRTCIKLPANALIPQRQRSLFKKISTLVRFLDLRPKAVTDMWSGCVRYSRISRIVRFFNIFFMQGCERPFSVTCVILSLPSLFGKKNPEVKQQDRTPCLFFGEFRKADWETASHIRPTFTFGRLLNKCGSFLRQLKVGPLRSEGFLRTGCGGVSGAWGKGGGHRVLREGAPPYFLPFQPCAKGLFQPAKCYTLRREKERERGGVGIGIGR